MLDTLLARFTHDQRISLMFAAAALVAGILAATFGFLIGEIAGVLLGYLTAGLLVMAVVHSWREPRHFLLLGVLSAGAFFVFSVLHNMFYAVAQLTLAYPIVSALFGALDALFFLLAVLFAPAAAAIGLVAAAMTWFAQRSKA